MGIITFDGIKSSTYSIEVSTPPRCIIPEEDYTINHIMGISGDRARRWRSYKNSTMEYSCNFICYYNPEVFNNYDLGDVNMDGELTAQDASLILRSTVGLAQLTDDQKLLADVNMDGRVDEEDAQLILRKLTNSLPDFPNMSFAESERHTFESLASAISKWLRPYHSKRELQKKLNKYKVYGTFEYDKDGYFRLEDTYSPNIYRKAFCNSSITIENLYNQAGAFRATFNCAPGRFYKIGEQWVSAMDTPNPSDLFYWNGTDRVIVHNPVGYESRPMIRIQLSIGAATRDTQAGATYFDSDKLPTIGQVVFVEKEEAATWKHVRFDMTGINTLFGLASNTVDAITLYLDCETCNMYAVPLSIAQIKNNEFDPASTTILSLNDHVRTDYPFTHDTGILVPGKNEVYVSFWGGGRLYQYRNFEILPRWWTL